MTESIWSNSDYNMTKKFSQWQTLILEHDWIIYTNKHHPLNITKFILKNDEFDL